jgi:3-oxoacyl-[acyl-carrier-protein] synthase-3
MTAPSRRPTAATFHEPAGVSLRALLAVVPASFRAIEELFARFGEAETRRAMRLTGVRSCPIAPPNVTAADLAFEAGRRLLLRAEVAAADVDGVILVTQTPDFLAPASACALQRRLGLPTRAAAFDVNLGCSGFPYGLLIARGLIATHVARRILVLAADTMSRMVDPDELGSAMAFGDAAAAALVEQSDSNDFFAADVGTSGQGYRRMIVAAGQHRFRTAAEFAARRPPELAAIVRPEWMHIEGAPVFSFAMEQLPGAIERILEQAGMSRPAVDYFFLSQGNRFIHEHLVDRMKLPLARCPVSVDRYGNTSTASTALTACDAAAAVNAARDLTACFLGYGTGLSWAGTLVRLRRGTLKPIERLADISTSSDIAGID